MCVHLHDFLDTLQSFPVQEDGQLCPYIGLSHSGTVNIVNILHVYAENIHCDIHLAVYAKISVRMCIYVLIMHNCLRSGLINYWGGGGCV